MYACASRPDMPLVNGNNLPCAQPNKDNDQQLRLISKKMQLSLLIQRNKLLEKRRNLKLHRLVSSSTSKSGP